MPGLLIRRCVGPDEEHGARGAIDHVARGGPEATWPGAGSVFVTCEHEQVHRLGGCDHLMFDAAAARIEHGIAPQGGLGFGEQFPRALLGQGLERLGGWPARAAEQGVTGTAGQFLSVARPNVQERDVGVGGQESGGRGHRGRPGLLDDPDEGTHHKPTGC
jgi:hypothetical protein